MMHSSFANNQIVTLHDQDWFDRQLIAGKCVAKCLKASKQLIEEQQPNLSLLDIEAICAEIIEKDNCTPTFFGYKGFPGKICASVNKQLVHGIPSGYQLKPGDVVKIDLGATYQGAIADAAITTIYGKAQSQKHIELIEVCQDALYYAIKSIEIGKQLGCIGYAIHKYISNHSRFGLITNYGGHGIDEDTPHASPFVSNKERYNEGIRIQSGLSIAIEPMLVIGDVKTYTKSDGWTVCTEDIGSHVEHSIFIHNDSVEIITWREDEKDKCPKRVYFNKKST